MSTFTPSRTDPPFVTPAWTLVEQLPERDPENDDSDEWEEDETYLSANLLQISYVTLDFGRYMKPEGFHHVREVQLTNVASPTPYARLGGQIFRGRHELLIGSEIILQHEDPDTTREASTSAYTPFATATSRIVFHPISVGGASVESQKRPRSAKVPKGTKKPPPVIKLAEPREPRPRGRPKGSVNKTKSKTPDAETEKDGEVGQSGGPDVVQPKPRGRPKGSGKGKGKAADVAAEQAEPEVEEVGQGEGDREGSSEAGNQRGEPAPEPGKEGEKTREVKERAPPKKRGPPPGTRGLTTMDTEELIVVNSTAGGLDAGPGPRTRAGERAGMDISTDAMDEEDVEMNDN
ncbi:hypothetical protein P7C70_g7306, partial [Phenoliferia sp. Uapishka_3]